MAKDTVEDAAVESIFAGTPLTLVRSPPGAGKTTLVCSTVSTLANRTHDLTTLVAVPTRRGCEDVAARIAEITGPGKVFLRGKAFERRRIPNVATEGNLDDLARDFKITVCTVASAVLTRPECDVLVFDEAYQTTFADSLAAAAKAKQLFMVGDPGQIGPVVTLPDLMFAGRKVSPVSRAPEGMLSHLDSKLTATYQMPATYRLGKPTAHAIAPLYDFSFESRRPDTVIDGFDELETIIAPRLSAPGDPKLINLAVKRVQELVGSICNGRPLTPRDVAVVASRNEQTSSLSAALAQVGLSRVTVGTADRLQGGQWLAVVAIDPITGADVASAHALETGRLCVMASRHIAHLTWISPRGWESTLTDSALLTEKEVEAHKQVRKRLGL